MAAHRFMRINLMNNLHKKAIAAASVLAVTILGITSVSSAGAKWALWCESHPMITSVQVIRGCYNTRPEAITARDYHNRHYHNDSPEATVFFDSDDTLC